MALNPRRDLKDLVVGRNKGSSFKEAPQTQLPPNPPLPSLPSPLGLLSNPNLQNKKRKEKDIEERGDSPLQRARSSRKLLKINGPPLWKARRTPLGLRCVDSSTLGLLGWSWKALPSHSLLLFGSSKGSIQLTLPKP